MHDIIKKLFNAHIHLLAISLLFVGSIESKQMQPKKVIESNQPGTSPIIVVPESKPLTYKTNADPEILDIDKSVKIINNSHDCNADKWDNNPNKACECCLSYAKGHFGTKHSADEIIGNCIHSKQCNPTSITNIKNKYNAQNISSEDFLDKIYQNTTVIHKITVDASLLKSDGTITEEGLSSILAQAYNEGKLQNKDFNNKKCLKAKSLGAGSGYNTVQLFLVTSSCTPSSQPLLYIIKESKKGLTESTNLKKVEEFPGIKELLAPNIVPGFPTISLPFFYFSYHPYHQKVHYIAAMPAAEGMVLYDLLKEFQADQSQKNADRIKKAYYILGKELGNFHKKFMQPATTEKVLNPTVAHGDFHPHNIFYDEKTGHFTFIDDETIVRYLKNPQIPTIDFIRLIFLPFSTDNTRYEFKELLTGVNPQTYLNLVLTPFLKGYISVYAPEKRKQLLLDLKEIFTGKIDAHPLHFDQQNLNDITKKYIIPIFNQIEKTVK
ncbi:MAG TPA: hypothetical protein VKU36_00835 [Candidatus Babeliales bacterium]|nr:hypothetical protein [Candidatus Babeliales bacterium]